MNCRCAQSASQRSSSVLDLAACWVLLLSTVGCGSSDRQALEGTVSLDGNPLPSGYISFVPMPGTKGPTAGAEITQGDFCILPEQGTFVGQFRVEITSLGKISNTKVRDEESGKLIDSYRQILPSRFNTESKLTVDVRAGTNNRFEFRVESK